MRSLLLFLSPILVGFSLAADSIPPNVVVFMADDMGMGDTSAFQDVTGNSDEVQIHTPGMEQLAAMGMRFSDAHTPSSRCTATRYGLMTGRYPWRSRLKHYVLFGSQGDPLIERDRPTLATIFQDHGYSTAMVGKWHIGLRYRNSEGGPAAEWLDADLTKPLFDSPLDHGFDICRFTSRSHGTSGATGKKNGPEQSVGPGHIDGRNILSSTGNGKELISEGDHVYDLHQLGSRHSDNAIQFVTNHVGGEDSWEKPFFLYYASNSNHSPYTPSPEIGGVAVAGEGKSVAGEKMGLRYDYVYENDVALARLIQFLSDTDDRRNEGKKLIENTIVIFTSDNGAEIKGKAATGPWRSNKGSGYEGGHRVPFIVAWPDGGVPAGETNESAIGLQDLFATFGDVVSREVTETGGEDSFSLLGSWKGGSGPVRPLFHNDHKEAKDAAAMAIRYDNPNVDGKEWAGKWKLFFDEKLSRSGEAFATELFELSSDPMESKNRLEEDALKPLVEFLTEEALRCRRLGGVTRTLPDSSQRFVLDFAEGGTGTDLKALLLDETNSESEMSLSESLAMKVAVDQKENDLGGKVYHFKPRGLGISGGKFGQVDSGEALEFSFDRDVLVESVSIVAGNGVCGGFCQMGERSPLAIYCVDADNDSKEQQGILSDLGWLKKGAVLRLDSSPHYGTEAPGQWRLQQMVVRTRE